MQIEPEPNCVIFGKGKVNLYEPILCGLSFSSVSSPFLTNNGPKHNLCGVSHPCGRVGGYCKTIRFACCNPQSRRN